MFIDDSLRSEYKYGVSKEKIIKDIREKYVRILITVTMQQIKENYHN